MGDGTTCDFVGCCQKAPPSIRDQLTLRRRQDAEIDESVRKVEINGQRRALWLHYTRQGHQPQSKELNLLRNYSNSII